MKKYKRLVYIGAGDKIAIKKLESIADTIILVDGCKHVTSRREHEAKNLKNVVVENWVISPSITTRNFYSYEDPSFNGLEPVSDDLCRLYPGLAKQEVQRADAITLESCLNNTGACDSDALLIVDLPIEAIDVACLAMDLETANDVILSFELMEAFKETLRSPLTHIAASTLLTDCFLDFSAIPAISSQVSLFNRIHAFESLEKHHEDLTRAYKELKEEVETLRNSIDEGKTVSALHSNQEIIIQNLEALTSDINNQKKFLDGSVKNATTQIECYVALDRFMANGEVSLAYHGWPLSTDISLYLVNKIQAEKPDHIVEFGSGTSTCLFANAIRYFYNNHEQEYKKVTTFEHNSTFLSKTTHQLNEKRLTDYVELVHAPLSEREYGTRKHQYYDCESTLEKFKRDSFKGKSLLVLVDGPPAVTCDLARYPALPLIIEKTSFSSIEFILDDFHREEEKAVLRQWEMYLNNHEITFTKQVIQCEKGAIVVKICR